ncbi:MAG: glycosyltransferase, partial [Deltaproteobacteria bacterium]|nr:glycosyltransferase [Deltaproteobacteria bacterium]
NYSKRLGIQDSVVFIGWQKDMPSIYGALDVVALTSMNEGTPVTLIEAMASGKQVVATDVGGVRDLLGMGATRSDEGYHLARNGILVPSGDSNSLAKALEYIMVNGKTHKTMAAHAREFVYNQFSMGRLVKDVKLLYSELV